MRFFFVIICHNVFNVRPKITLLLPVLPRDAQRLDSPALENHSQLLESKDMLVKDEGGILRGSGRSDHMRHLTVVSPPSSFDSRNGHG